MHHVWNGSEAIEYLKGEGKYADRAMFPLPYVVLSDLKMPKINGFELLEWIRRQSEFPYLPVVVLTSSDEVRDIQKAYGLGANSFLVKPYHPDELNEIVTMLNGFWIRLNKTNGDASPPMTDTKGMDANLFSNQN